EPSEVETLGAWSAPTVLDPGMPGEFLIQRSKGRYLWLRIEAFGDGVVTPVVEGIDLYGPRQGQVDLLPAPFHQDPISRDFLDRFLSLQDGFYGEALQAFANVGAILDPDATPQEFLDWLGNWFDWRFAAQWDDATRREMIAQSMQFFAERGTVCGLLRLLRWHTGLDGALPCLIEEFRLSDTPIEDSDGVIWMAGQPLPRPDDGAHRFVVVLPSSAVPDAAARQTLEALLDAQKPAHTQLRLIVVEPQLIPGRQARLGVDAVLPDSRPPGLSDAQLGHDLVTTPVC
ncbi:MAG: hypothetical protein HRU31_19285, partial [Rhodobacteraceae bacterium]|nr:hypothetical protein [Paracoccaceae bacterium]